MSQECSTVDLCLQCSQIDLPLIQNGTSTFKKASDLNLSEKRKENDCYYKIMAWNLLSKSGDLVADEILIG